MAILITGHKGFIGSRLFSKVGGIGIDLKDGLNLLTCELPDNIHLIYHLAAQSDVVPSWSDPLHDLDNIRITARLVKKYPEAKIVYANSAAAKPPISSPYGFSKWASGEYLKHFHKNSVICMFPNIYGPGSRSVVDLFKGKEEVDIYGDGLQTRDYVHVDDIISALLKAPYWEPAEYQLGSGIATTVLSLAEGKYIRERPAREEARESVLENNTPNWHHTINVHEYLQD